MYVRIFIYKGTNNNVFRRLITILKKKLTTGCRIRCGVVVRVEVNRIKILGQFRISGLFGSVRSSGLPTQNTNLPFGRKARNFDKSADLKLKCGLYAELWVSTVVDRSSEHCSQVNINSRELDRLDELCQRRRRCDPSSRKRRVDQMETRRKHTYA